MGTKGDISIVGISSLSVSTLVFLEEISQYQCMGPDSAEFEITPGDSVTMCWELRT